MDIIANHLPLVIVVFSFLPNVKDWMEVWIALSDLHFLIQAMHILYFQFNLVHYGNVSLIDAYPSFKVGTALS